MSEFDRESVISDSDQAFEAMNAMMKTQERASLDPEKILDELDLDKIPEIDEESYSEEETYSQNEDDEYSANDHHVSTISVSDANDRRDYDRRHRDHRDRRHRDDRHYDRRDDDVESAIDDHIERPIAHMTSAEKEAELASNRMVIQNIVKQMETEHHCKMNINAADIETSNLEKQRKLLNQVTAMWQSTMWTNLAQELLVKGASILESVFNGERQILGTRPNLTGYSETVNIITTNNMPTIQRMVANNMSHDGSSATKSLILQLALGALTQNSAGSSTSAMGSTGDAIP